MNLFKANPKTERPHAVGRWLCKLAFALSLPVLLVLPATTCAVAENFQLSLDGGSVITVDVADITIDWTDVTENGDMTKRSVPFSDVKQLLLSKAPASKQVAEVRRYLSLLGSDEYLERENAEEKLSDPDIGGRFKSLIKIRSEKGSFEVRYRIKRILGRLDDIADLPSSEFDRLTLKDGSVFEGDAGDLTINCNFRGNKSSFKRDDLRLISTPIAPPKPLAADEKIEVRMFHKHEDIDDKGEKVPYFYRDDQVLVDFNNAPNGAELVRYAEINETFVPFGLRLDSTTKGYMGISGYPFKFAPLPVSDNSICVTETIGTYPKRFKGVAELRFCLPNQAAVPAGVFEVGLFIARINHSRDFLLEAYNVDGELLASVESTDQSCVFSGVKANEPITKVRILSNPYLFRIDRSIDEDFAIDSVCFSPPVPVSTPTDSRPGVIRLKNGDLLRGIEISDIVSAEYLKLIDETAMQALKTDVHTEEGLGELLNSFVTLGTEKIFEEALQERLEKADSPELKEALRKIESGWKKRPEAPEKNSGKGSLAHLNAQMFNTIKVVDDKTVSIQVAQTETMTLPLAELQTIRFANELDGALSKEKKLKIGANKQGPNTWVAILKDRSTLFVEAGEKLTSTTFNLSFDAEDIAALKCSRNPTRYPEASDFENGKRVLVFPTCRIASDNLKFSKDGFQWDPADKKIEQPVILDLEDNDEEPEDPTPQFNSISYAEATPEGTPTLWLTPPTGQLAGTGKLRLTDGQQLTLGSENGFKIARFDKRSVVISIDGKEIPIPIEKVLSIEFPK